MNNNTPIEMQVEDLVRFRDSGYCTVGDLLEFIHRKIASGEITRESIVLSQRVEDKYFEEHDWSVIKKEGEQFHWSKEYNERMKNGSYPEEARNLKLVSEQELEDSKDQYHPIWTALVYDGDKNLYLNLHY